MFNNLEQQKGDLGSINAELERQAKIYRGLGISKDDIMRLAAPRPDFLPYELSIPIITLGSSVDLDRQAKYAGITTNFNLSLAHDDAGAITYGSPHLIWMHDGTKFEGQTIEWSLNQMTPGERPATIADGIALALVYRNIHRTFKGHNIDLRGSAMGSMGTVILGQGSRGFVLSHVSSHHGRRDWCLALSGG